MHLLPILAEGGHPAGHRLDHPRGRSFVAVVIVIIFITFLSRYTKVGPNQVLIVSGRKHRLEDGSTVGFRIVKGGGTFVMPVLKGGPPLARIADHRRADPGSLYQQGCAVKVDGVAQIQGQGRRRIHPHRLGTISRQGPG